MLAWDVDLYLQFGNERTQPAVDLISRVTVSHPQRVIDLGCGPGNSTEMLRRRWPNATITGLDSSPEMIAEARKRYADQAWILADAGAWAASEPYDLVFSNAALHWIPNHDELVCHLLAQVAPGGALAFQIPNHIHSPLHQAILQIAAEPHWRQQMQTAKSALTIERPSFYFDALAQSAVKIDIWETDYYHILEDAPAIVHWIRSTGLRPFLEALDTEDQRQHFLKALTERVVDAYPPQKNGKVLFPFRRLFVVAYR
jgi:trans-aconitate 2-methyltransferase